MSSIGNLLYKSKASVLSLSKTRQDTGAFLHIVSDPDEDLAIIEDTHLVTFMPKLYLKNHPTLISRPIQGIGEELMSNAHWMKDVPMKRSAQLFPDIIRYEAIPYIKALEETM